MENGRIFIDEQKRFAKNDFAEKYHYEGDDLGAIICGDKTTFKLWAPTASRVVLNLYEYGGGDRAYKNVDMKMGDKGVWSHTESCGHGVYYTYTVTTRAGAQEAVDPYARAVGVNGMRGMVVDLCRTDPKGFRECKLKNIIKSYFEAVIWEIHLRDFSNKIKASMYKGKYLAFRERGLKNEYGEPVGIDYLVDLGVTHVHLLPVFDFGSVNEREPDFNWGYDPENYNAPEGSYSTNPYDGEVRIREFKEMVMALHKAGIGVIMDMVYNHTYHQNSSFNKIVPYYYYRYNASGGNTSASGCGNDTASERYMFRKFMVESAAYWVEEYMLDGLRFDLMGLHDLETMQEIERAVHKINPNAIIYGEGWTMGETLDGSTQANQTNIGKIIPTNGAIGGIAVFNDVMRDGLKGSALEVDDRGYINGNAEKSADAVIFGIKGGEAGGQDWRVRDGMVINYMSAHDNHTLWDKLSLSNPDGSEQERAKMNRLGAAIIMLAKGTPFFQAGEEMLRTKRGDGNSYKSSDKINNIDWSVLKRGAPQYNTREYYKGLIKMRRGHSIFTAPDTDINITQQKSGAMKIHYTAKGGSQALALLNPKSEDVTFALDGEWGLIADGERAGKKILSHESGEITVSGISAAVLLKNE